MFNEKPKKAITYLQENGLLGKTAEEVAQFLIMDERLDKTMVRWNALLCLQKTHLLADRRVSRRPARIQHQSHAFVHRSARLFRYDHKAVTQLCNSLSSSATGSKTFIDSLRLFLTGFRLPGEAQKIDRLMEKFAQRYCEGHPQNGVFASADAAYVLAYSVIMLTTDLHSTKVFFIA